MRETCMHGHARWRAVLHFEEFRYFRSKPPWLEHRSAISGDSVAKVSSSVSTKSRHIAEAEMPCRNRKIGGRSFTSSVGSSSRPAGSKAYSTVDCRLRRQPQGTKESHLKLRLIGAFRPSGQLFDAFRYAAQGVSNVKHCNCEW